MDYISVKEAALKFNLSERRIQKLCESERITGSHMVSGIWLIPANAKKPSDERMSEAPKNKDYITLKELCHELTISIATGRNWLKLNKIQAQYFENNTPFFTKTYVDAIKNDIFSGKKTFLKSRRNKKFISGNFLYKSYVSDTNFNLPICQNLLHMIDTEKINLSSENIMYIIAECAIQLLLKRNTNIFSDDSKHFLLQYLNDKLFISKYSKLIDALIDNKEAAIAFCKKYPSLFNLNYKYEKNEDVLGLIYISCKNIGNRKATGSYFTPTSIVKKIISRLNFQSADTILDPCCGTGNFLLQLPELCSFENIYGNDIDLISVKIARINMALKFPDAAPDIICQHITNMDYLNVFPNDKFNFVIGNPPWGFDFSNEMKKNLVEKFNAINGKNIESYDIFIEKAFKNLTHNGHIAYILPEAVLNVKSHINIRKIILQISSINYIEFLGNAFDGVQCPCIFLDLVYTGQNLSTVNTTITNGIEKFTIKTKRNITADNFTFITNDSEYAILEKIKKRPDIIMLKNNADFALGIVTGNNKKYISNNKTADNEMILKGSDISKYHIKQSDNYIIFTPENFQQVAPVQMYRAPEKLFYRFICNQLVFAYDNRQTLSLNSCNIVIPRIDGLHIKYILAILNSRIAQFIYKKEFNSVKVLRNHIEHIPIPIVSEQKQNEIIELTDILIRGIDDEQTYIIYDKLDDIIFNLWALSNDEINIIKNAIDNENMFLTP